MRLTFQQLKRLNTDHGINLLSGVPKDKLTDFDFWHTILVVALGGESEALAYESDKTFVEIVNCVTEAVTGQSTGGAAADASAPKS